MKYLQDYIEKEQTELFNELGVFFAFSKDQFDEGARKNRDKKPEGTKWANCGAGMFMPTVNVDEFIERHDALHKKAIEKDLAENGREGVLERELANYEIGYCYDGPNDRNFRDGIKGYGFTEDEISQAYKKHIENNEY